MFKVYIYYFVFLIAYVFAVHHSYGQSELNEYPSCNSLKKTTSITLDSVVKLSNHFYLIDPKKSFCYLLEAKIKAKNNKQKEIIAINAKQKSDSLYRKAKYKNAIYFASLSAEIWSEINAFEKQAKQLIDISDNYYYLGDLYNAINYANKALSISEQHQLNKAKYSSINALGWCYWKIKNLKIAEKYIKQSRKMIDDGLISDNLINYYNAMGTLHDKRKQYNLAIKYNDSAIILASSENNNRMKALCISNKASYLIKKKGNYDSILKMTKRALIINEAMQDKEQMSSNLALLAEAYLYNNEYDNAIKAAKQALDIAEEINRKPNKIMDYNFLREAYHKKGDDRNAYKYAEKYNQLYEELYGPINIVKIFEIQQKNASALNKSIISNLKKEKQLNKVKHERDKRTFWFAATILTLLFTGFFILFIVYRNNQRRKDNDIRKRLKYDLMKMEMEALRAKMNPHFLFNSLNSINSFIVKKDAKSASKYLTKFATLVRMILNHSKHKLITLDEELEAIKYYIDLEKVRLKDRFDYNIKIESTIELSEVLIPPSIIQPFVENAIWHGLSTLSQKGLLLVNIYKKEKSICIEITDNGIGRRKAEKIKFKKHQSTATNIIQKTMSAFKEDTDISLKVNTIDLYDKQQKPNGTKVLIEIKNL